MTLAHHIDVLSPESAQWASVLERVPHDVYHTAKYHRVPGFGQVGAARAFSYEEGDRVFLWPYLLAPIPGAEGYHDVTSVYGYPGPVGSADPAFLSRAWEALLDHWKAQRVVSVFTRFHPILENSSLLLAIPAAAEGIKVYGSTVSIDLKLPAETQYRQYNKKLRQEIGKARRAGLVTVEDEQWKHLDDFVRVYSETMARRSCRPEYLVNHAWVHTFREMLGEHAHLFITKIDDEIAAAMIVVEYQPFVHCHLLGSAPKFAELSPSKVMLDDVRIWGTSHGYGCLHLGGGLGGKEDDLFRFKRRFSETAHPFETGSWILDPVCFEQLEAEHRARLEAQGHDLSDVSFFPAYRYVPHNPS